MDSARIDALARSVIDAGFHIHADLGPGLFESVYEALLANVLQSSGLKVERQQLIAIEYRGAFIPDAFKVDLVVEGILPIELKSLDRLAPVHSKQLPTYLRLMKLPIGLLINFGGETFKEGVKRIANNHTDLASWRLGANMSKAAGDRQ